MIRGVAKRVGGRDKFGLANLPASSNLSHVGIRRANLTRALLARDKLRQIWRKIAPPKFRQI